MQRRGPSPAASAVREDVGSPAAIDAGEGDCLAATIRTWQDNVTGAISAQSYVQLNYKMATSPHSEMTIGALSCVCRLQSGKILDSTRALAQSNLLQRLQNVIRFH